MKDTFAELISLHTWAELTAIIVVVTFIMVAVA